MPDKRKVGSRIVKSREVNHSEQALTKLDSLRNEKAKRNADHVKITTSNLTSNLTSNFTLFCIIIAMEIKCLNGHLSSKAVNVFRKINGRDIIVYKNNSW